MDENRLDTPRKVKTTSGLQVEISLEDWVKDIIEKTYREAYLRCPLREDIMVVERMHKEEDLKSKVEALELKMKFVQWIGGTISSLALAHLATTIASVVKNTSRVAVIGEFIGNLFG